MHEKRYSVFISSTYEDLKQERQAVQDVVISAGDFPVQMEFFPAADVDQFEFIKTLIDKCDYYVLIVAGRYGSPTDDGMSYTEKEYHYAVSRGIPVLVLLHAERGSIPANKSEDLQAGKRRLAAFVAELETNRVRKAWRTTDSLKLAVREALDYAKATKSAIGWVRGDAVASIETLEELNEVRKENAKFRDAIGSLEIKLALPPMPVADDTTLIDILPNKGSGRSSSHGSAATVRTTWISAFPAFFNNLKWQSNNWNSEDSYYVDEQEFCIEIGSAIAGELDLIDAARHFKLSKATLKRLSSYYIEAGLMNPTEREQAFTEAAQKVSGGTILLGKSRAPLPSSREKSR